MAAAASAAAGVQTGYPYPLSYEEIFRRLRQDSSDVPSGLDSLEGTIYFLLSRLSGRGDVSVDFGGHSEPSYVYLGDVRVGLFSQDIYDAALVSVLELHFRSCQYQVRRGSAAELPQRIFDDGERLRSRRTHDYPVLFVGQGIDLTSPDGWRLYWVDSVHGDIHHDACIVCGDDVSVDLRDVDICCETDSFCEDFRGDYEYIFGWDFTVRFPDDYIDDADDVDDGFVDDE